jgi:hypothetical protein
MVLFLQGIINRPCAKRGRKPKEKLDATGSVIADSGPSQEPGKTIGIQVVRQYASAVMDIWQTQHKVLQHGITIAKPKLDGPSYPSFYRQAVD